MGRASVTAPVLGARPVNWAPSNRSMLGAVHWPGGSGTKLDEIAASLVARYRPVLGDTTSAWTEWRDDIDVGIVLVTAGPIAIPSDAEPLVWGCPVGPEGSVTLDDVQSVLATPARARDVDGVWVAVGRRGGVRLVSTGTPVHTLKRVDGHGRTAFATRGLAAHVLAGVRPELDVDRVPEFVAFAYVLGDAELLKGTRVLDPASVVDLTGASPSVGRWDEPDGTLRGPGGADPASLRSAVRGAARRARQVDGAWLGLTAGRDSALIASCLAEDGRPVSTFTMGWAGLPDVDGAKAQATSLGWRHEVAEAVLLGGGPARGARSEDLMAPDVSLNALVESAAWTEGLDHPRNVLAGRVRWPHRGVRWVTGHGGETGRAFYWKKAGPDAEPIDAICGIRTARLDVAARALVRDAVSAAVDRVRDAGFSGPAALDAFYVMERMRKWLGRGIPLEQIDDVVPVYLDRTVLPVLLALPVAQRRTGAAFDAALAAGNVDLRRLGRHAAFGGRVQRAIPRVARRLGWQRGHEWDEPLLAPLVREIAAQPRATEILGHGWWEATGEAARRGGVPRLMLWNALGVEALARYLDSEPSS